MQTFTMQTYEAVVAASWFVLIVVWLIAAIVLGTPGRAKMSARGRIVRLLLVVALWIAIGYGYRFQTSNLLELAATGSALCIVGCAFAIWARFSLGRSWGMPMTVHAQPELVTSGPYRFVRHPIYTGIGVMLVGTSFVYPLGALPSAAFIAYFIFSARREEGDMERRFPDAYPVYKQQSKMLIPFLF
jgi:protein-S-isoprenylcysteine O-methyltransferase Ste14